METKTNELSDNTPPSIGKKSGFPFSSMGAGRTGGGGQNISFPRATGEDSSRVNFLKKKTKGEGKGKERKMTNGDTALWEIPVQTGKREKRAANLKNPAPPARLPNR